MPARRPRRKLARRPRTTASDPAPVAPEAGDTRAFPKDFRYPHDAFMTMVNAGMDEHNKKFTVAQAIYDWWMPIMRSPFPEEVHTAYEYVLALQYQSLMNSYERYGMTPPLKFAKNWKAATTFNPAEFMPGMHSIFQAEQYGQLGQIMVYPPQPEGEEMATRKTKSTTKAEAKGGGKKADGKPPLSKLVMQLVHEQKLTDAEIVARCQKEYPERKFGDTVAKLYRAEMNKGNKERVGYPKPKKPYAEITKDAAPARKQRGSKGKAPSPKAASTGRKRKRARG